LNLPPPPETDAGEGAGLIFDLMIEPLRADLDGYWTCS